MGANQSGATTLNGAVERLSASLAEPEQPTAAEPVEAQEVPKTEEATTEPETQTEVVSDTQSEVERYTVKVNGEEKQVTLDEMRSGYMMEADYRSKTTDVAEQRKALDVKAAQIDTNLSEAHTLIEMELTNLQSPEMVELKQVDPESYLKEFDRVQGKVNQFNQLKAQRQGEQQEHKRTLLTKELELLDAAIPEWLDPDVRKKETGDIMKRWADQGYSQEEISTGDKFLDHRSFVDSRKAMLFDQLMSQDLSSKEVKAPLKSVQPAAAGTTSTTAEQNTKSLRGKLKKSGSTRDAAAIFRSLME